MYLFETTMLIAMHCMDAAVVLSNNEEHGIFEKMFTFGRAILFIKEL